MKKIVEVVECLRTWAKPNGYDPMIPFAQGHLETGGYECELAKHNNFFGMFNTSNWRGEVYECLTHEYEMIDGKMQRVPHITKFKTFDNPTECFVEYDKYIQGKFPEAYRHRTEYKIYYKQLMTYVGDFKENKRIISPSFCTAIGYESACMDRYELLLKGSGGYELFEVMNV